MKPEDRRIRALLVPIVQQLRVISFRLKQIRAQQESSSRDQQQASNEAATRTIAAISKLQAIRANEDSNQAGQQNTGPGPWLSFSVQVSLCIFTAAAFAAAAWYAHIAHLQKNTMGDQLTTMNNTFKEVQTQSKAASDQVVLMRQQLETQAAVVNFSVDIIAPMKNSEGFYQVWVRPRLQNFGHAIASKIHGRLPIFLIKIPSKQRERQLGDVDLSGTPNLEASSFPTPQQRIERSYLFSLTGSEPDDINSGILAVILDGTVIYDTGFGTETNQSVCYADWHYQFHPPTGPTDLRGQGPRPCTESYGNLPTLLEEQAKAAVRENLEKQKGQPKNQP